MSDLIGGTPYRCDDCGLPSGSPTCHKCRNKPRKPPIQHLYRSDGARFSLNEDDGTYSLDSSVMHDPHRYDFITLLTTGEFSIHPPLQKRSLGRLDISCSNCIHYGLLKTKDPSQNQPICMAPITTEPPANGTTRTKYAFVYPASPTGCCELHTLSDTIS